VVQSGFQPAGGRPLLSHPVHRIVFGHFRVGSHPAEEVVVCRRSADSVELHCHGGHAAVSRIHQMLVDEGCRSVSWQDWAANHHQDPLAAAARIALADARTVRTAAILLDQHHGALGRAVEGVRHSLNLGDMASARAHLAGLVAKAELGRHLVRPWRVVLAGSPNVGKSSLINAIVGYGRAIVHAAPGTTRDIVSAITAVDGWPIELSDTAGLRESGPPLEQAGIELARLKLACAELVLLVFDSSQPWSDTDRQLIDEWPDAMVIHSKCDLLPCRDSPRPEGLLTSAVTGQGIEESVGQIAGRLVPDPPPPGAAVPFSEDQIRQLESAASALADGHLDGALAALDGLLP
jgi:tRNA modification GTPase